MADGALRSLLWASRASWAAVLGPDGAIRAVNPALEGAMGAGLVGERAGALVSAPQRAELERRVAEARADEWSTVLVGFHDGGSGSAADRLVHLRREGAETLLVAEPALDEGARLVEQVLALNDDLIAAQRALARRQRELQTAEASSRTASERVTRLETITMHAFGDLELDDALRTAVEVAVEVLGARGGAIALRDERDGSLRRRVAVGLEDGEEGPRTALPLELGGETVGELFVLAEADEELLGLVADRTVLAIAHVELRDREARLAQALQRALLPLRLPDDPRLELCARHRAVVRDAAVGGDFYDAIALDDGRMGLCIGDVTGKGLRAAATMGRLRSTLRAYAVDGASPARVLDRLDRFMEDEEDMATAIYLVLDPASGEGVLARAGHPAPLLVGPDGASSELTGGSSTPLGTGERDRPEAAFALPADGRLLLFTDGLVERRTGGILGGLARLRELVAAPGLALGDLCDGLIAAMEHDGYVDDVAVLAVQRRR